MDLLLVALSLNLFAVINLHKTIIGQLNSDRMKRVSNYIKLKQIAYLILMSAHRDFVENRINPCVCYNLKSQTFSHRLSFGSFKK